MREIYNDSYNRPCARILLQIDGMTASEMEQIKVIPTGNFIVVMEQNVYYFNKTLAIDLTANKPTRFYLHHDKYGDSNEVALNLAGDTEYKLAASLNVASAIYIATDVSFASIILDDSYVGYTDMYGTAYIYNVMHGTHTLKIQTDNSCVEHTIEVNNDALHFELTGRPELANIQEVIFNIGSIIGDGNAKSSIAIEDAKVVINEEQYSADEGGNVRTTLRPGTYDYIVSAPNYHDERGSFTVDGKQVTIEVNLKPAFGWLTINESSELNGANIYVDGKLIGTNSVNRVALASGEHKIMIAKKLYLPYEQTIYIKDNETLIIDPTLTANYSNVTLTTATGADIYINNTKMGTTSWTGILECGTYIFETRKPKHTSTRLTKEISSDHTKQIIALDAPTPITGSVEINCDPHKCAVKIDNVYAGYTPLTTDLIIGTHEITASWPGRTTQSTIVQIDKGRTTQVKLQLDKRSRSAGFNFGISAGYGRETYSLEGWNYDTESFHDIEKISSTWNFGVTWRLWRYNSLFNVTTGVHIINDDGYIYTSVPAVLNLTLFSGSLKKCVPYIGIGSEFTNSSNKNTPLILQAGLGCRYCDFCFYKKTYETSNDYDYSYDYFLHEKYGFRFTLFL